VLGERSLLVVETLKAERVVLTLNLNIVLPGFQKRQVGLFHWPQTYKITLNHSLFSYPHPSLVVSIALPREKVNQV
jgi:hypothetical protein